jgi:hypothetical protein
MFNPTQVICRGKIFILILSTFISVPCSAIDIEFFGISKAGEKVIIAEADYSLQKQNDGKVVFTGSPKYGFCTPSAIEVNGEFKGEFLLSCAPEIGKNPTLVYKADANQEGNRNYQIARRVFKRSFSSRSENESNGRDFGGYYRCVKGCSPEFANLLVKLVYRH